MTGKQQSWDIPGQTWMDGHFYQKKTLGSQGQ